MTFEYEGTLEGHPYGTERRSYIVNLSFRNDKTTTEELKTNEKRFGLSFVVFRSYRVARTSTFYDERTTDLRWTHSIFDEKKRLKQDSNHGCWSSEADALPAAPLRHFFFSVCVDGIFDNGRPAQSAEYNKSTLRRPPLRFEPRVTSGIKTVLPERIGRSDNRAVKKYPAI